MKWNLQHRFKDCSRRNFLGEKTGGEAEGVNMKGGTFVKTKRENSRCNYNKQEKIGEELEVEVFSIYQEQMPR